jgi:hypothetical protein
MDHPDERGAEGEIRGSGRRRHPGRRQFQRPAHDAEHQQRAPDVKREVAQVVAPNIQPSRRVIEREREVHERTPGGRELPFGKKHAAEAPPLANRGVLDDR